MLSDVITESTIRFREVSNFLRVIKEASNTRSRGYSSHNQILKGLFFVHLYGAYEFTIVSAVQKVLEAIDSASHPLSSFEPLFLSIVLDDRCRAVSDVGKSKTWEKRWALFELIGAGDAVPIDNSILPTDGKNIRFKQLQSIWKTLCVKAPVLSKPLLQGRIEELVENRNAIAHGSASAADVGRRFTYSDLEKRYADIDEYCLYVTQTLEDYFNNQDFLR